MITAKEATALATKPNARETADAELATIDKLIRESAARKERGIVYWTRHISDMSAYRMMLDELDAAGYTLIMGTENGKPLKVYIAW